MKKVFTIQKINSKTIKELENAWNLEDYKALLDIMEYGDTSQLSIEDASVLCLMSLSDYEPEDAAVLVMTYVFGSKLTRGQINNVSHEMREEKMWEEYADLSLHESFFTIGQLLYQAYDGRFPHPEAVSFHLKITAQHPNDLSVFDTDLEVHLIRLLAQGLPKNAKINRLFEDQLNGKAFSEAKDIIWQITKDRGADGALIIKFISSLYWFEDLKYTDGFESVLTIS
ncbi:hypothetical protein ACFO3O_11775 [Dokdonia ponticola]|uniref:Uncharacterized protein n=1 Tax=Dokdonia ponticola TaxID=2041041 RepID=A0ABV9HWR2_9FLAO